MLYEIRDSNRNVIAALGQGPGEADLWMPVTSWLAQKGVLPTFNKLGQQVSPQDWRVIGFAVLPDGQINLTLSLPNKPFQQQVGKIDPNKSTMLVPVSYVAEFKDILKKSSIISSASVEKIPTGTPWGIIFITSSLLAVAGGLLWWFLRGRKGEVQE